jgi:hypothetical protein
MPATDDYDELDPEVGLRDLIRTLDVFREASSPEPSRSRRFYAAAS